VADVLLDEARTQMDVELLEVLVADRCHGTGDPADWSDAWPRISGRGRTGARRSRSFARTVQRRRDGRGPRAYRL